MIYFLNSSIKFINLRTERIKYKDCRRDYKQIFDYLNIELNKLKLSIQRYIQLLPFYSNATFQSYTHAFYQQFITNKDQDLSVEPIQ